jgi:DNA-directed RNA polymerase subunit RPC12/RpoP
MAYTFFCPSCGKRFDKEENLAGKKARCKDCQHVFIIPAAAGPRSAPVARTQPRPSPARSASPAPSFPANDPYGLDESPVVHPGRDPYAITDDEDYVPLQPVRPGATAARKPKRQSGNEFAWVQPLTVGFIGLEIILLLLTGYLMCAQRPGAATVAAETFDKIAFGMALLGIVVLLIIAFRESVPQGFLCFIPCYPLYYYYSRWPATKPPFLITLSVVTLRLLAIVSLYAISVSPLADPRAERKQPEALANVAATTVTSPPRPAAAPASAPPTPVQLLSPPGGISLVLNVSGVVDPKVAAAMGRRIALIALELDPAARQIRYVRQGNQLIFWFAPLRDAQAYADRVNFGTVTSVKGGTIIVTVTPDSAAQVATAAPASPAPEPPSAPAPRPAGPRRFPRRPPMGGLRPR